MKSIAIDMDEVVADTLMGFINWHKKETGVEVEKAEVYAKGGYFYEYLGQDRAGPVRQYMLQEGFFRALPVIKDSQEVIRWLSEHFEIYFVTATMPFRNALTDKYDWLLEYFSFIPLSHYIFCGDKSKIATDYMIDDHAYNLATFRGKGLLYHASHNIHETDYLRVKNWKEVRAYFEKELIESTTI